MSAPSGSEALHRRLLLDLCHLAQEPDGISAAAEFAQLLQRELVGVYVEDEALCSLAGLPFARELQLPAHAWSPIGTAGVEAAFREAALRLRGILQRQGSHHGVASRFECARGDPAGFVAAMSRETDILAIGLPPGPSGRAFGSFRDAWRAAMRSRAAILLLPARIARRRGPIAAILGDEGLQGAATAATLAAATGEDLLLLRGRREPEASPVALREALRAAGLEEARLRMLVLDRDTPEAVAQALTRAAGRMLLLDRRRGGPDGAEDALALSEALRIPILME